MMSAPGEGRMRRWRRRALVLWLVLLVASHAYRFARAEEPALPPGLSTVFVPAFEGFEGSDEVRIAYRDEPAAEPNAPVVVLLHGSPGSHSDFDRVVLELEKRYRLVIPDLPGFGAPWPSGCSASWRGRPSSSTRW